MFEWILTSVESFIAFGLEACEAIPELQQQHAGFVVCVSVLFGHLFNAKTHAHFAKLNLENIYVLEKRLGKPG